jgi:hypothetical protein
LAEVFYVIVMSQLSSSPKLPIFCSSTGVLERRKEVKMLLIWQPGFPVFNLNSAPAGSMAGILG